MKVRGYKPLWVHLSLPPLTHSGPLSPLNVLLYLLERGVRKHATPHVLPHAFAEVCEHRLEDEDRLREATHRH